jgi:putative oxidoreductase
VDGQHCSAEFFGGIALLLGLLTRPAAIVTAFTMLIAIFSAHISNGLFLTNNGYEYALSLLAVTVALSIQGGGHLALDNLLARAFANQQDQLTLNPRSALAH